MANPFEELLFGARASTPGDVRGGMFPAAPGLEAPAPMAANPLAAAQSPMQATAAMPQGRQYNPMIDPQIGGILGSIGKMTGAMTRDEYNTQRLGSARGQAAQAIQQRMSQGASSQKAISDFVSTPDGMQFFMQDPEGLESIMDYVKAITPPEAGFNVLSPGSQAFDDRGNPVAAVGTAEMQNRDSLMELGQLGPEARKELGRATLLKELQGDPSEQKSALDALVRDGAVSQDTANRILGGALVVKPLQNRYGETVGHTVYDITNGTTTMLDDQSTADPTADPRVFTPEAEVQPASTYFSQLEDPADIIEGAGLGPIFEQGIGGFIGQQYPEFSGEQAAIRRNGLAAIRAQGQTLREFVGSRGLAMDAKLIDDLVNPLGAGINPIQAGQNLLSMHDLLDRREQVATQELSNPQTSQDVRGKAADEIYQITQMRASMPPRANLEAKLKTLREGGGPKLSDTGKTLADEAGVIAKDAGITGGAQPPAEAAPRVFQTIEEYNAAGPLPSGTRVIVGGRAGTVN